MSLASQEGISALPLLKWAGGKRQLIDVILAHLPAKMETYFEPFVGGGAVFFALAAEGRFRHARLSDQNRELIETYRAVRDDVDEVIAELSLMDHSEDDYYRIRATNPRKPARRAARMIYLNRTGYNGLYRVNRAGRFNVPFGRYKNPKICDEARLRAVARALAGVELSVADFETACSDARCGDAVYFDPPYVPVSATARFAEYHHQPFGSHEHERLADLYRRLACKGVSTLLSNSDVPFTRGLYREFDVGTVAARRNINSRATARGPISELLVVGGQSRVKAARPRRLSLPAPIARAVGDGL
jgi:DNA adenine methylase